MENNAKPASLPYVNNFWSIFSTALINAVCILLFFWNRDITRADVLIAAVACGAITSVNNVLIAAHFIEKLRDAGALPTQAPQSRFMMRLPKNKFLLILIFAVFFGAFAALANELVLRFYGITTFRLARLAVWQAIYSCLLASVITELAVLRFVQPDHDKPGQPPQTGAAEVHNPLSRLASFTTWFNTVTDDFGFNMLIGLLLGGTLVTADHNVVITPTTRAGIVISSLILGLIVTLRMAYPIAKSMYDARASGALPPLANQTKWLARLPYKPWKMTAVLALPIMLLSLLVFWGVLTFFGFEVLDFFQFFVIRTAYVSVLAKGVVWLVLTRYRQPAASTVAG